MKQLQLHMSLKHLPAEESSSPAFFLIRTTPNPVPSPSSPEEATATLSSCFEMGTMDSGHPLQALSKTLSHLYMPMLMIAGTCTCIFKSWSAYTCTTKFGSMIMYMYHTHVHVHDTCIYDVLLCLFMCTFTNMWYLGIIIALYILDLTQPAELPWYM